MLFPVLNQQPLLSDKQSLATVFVHLCISFLVREGGLCRCVDINCQGLPVSTSLEGANLWGVGLILSNHGSIVGSIAVLKLRFGIFLLSFDGWSGWNSNMEIARRHETLAGWERDGGVRSEHSWQPHVSSRQGWSGRWTSSAGKHSIVWITER